MSDFWKPEFSASQPRPGMPQPSDEDVVKALVEIQNASSAPAPSADSPIHVVAEPSSTKWVVVAAALAMIAAAGYVGRQQLQQLQQLAKVAGPRVTKRTSAPSMNGPSQVAAEQLLQRLASGDAAAADEVLAHSSEWTGKAQRTPKSEQLVTAALNSPDLHIRQAALQAEIVLDGVTLDEAGVTYVKSVLGNPQQRTWALWMLGALANRGIDTDHNAKIIETYLADPDVTVRAASVDALGMVATDETVPMMLDRFRNDPSPVVQERAACGLAQSGMYTQTQRMTASKNLVDWLDDSLLTQQQHGWAVQALGDISGQHFGNDVAAWRRWIDSNR
jgi:HEAT repeat protein